MTAPSARFTRDLIGFLPALKAFAISLTGRSDRADDLVQETVMKAWAAAASFQEGTNMKAWLFTILRNIALTQFSRAKREVEDVDDKIAAAVPSPGEQEGKIAMNEMHAALAKLPADQREAVILVGAAGFSYEEAAEMCGVALGTLKSRVSRGRVALAAILYGSEAAVADVAT
jgi:RNA polymerase sigma-70 factor (ECF subfamily)